MISGLSITVYVGARPLSSRKAMMRLRPHFTTHNYIFRAKRQTKKLVLNYKKSEICPTGLHLASYFCRQMCLSLFVKVVNHFLFHFPMPPAALAAGDFLHIPRELVSFFLFNDFLINVITKWENYSPKYCRNKDYYCISEIVRI